MTTFHISKTVEKVLIQLWSFFHDSGKRTASYTKAVIASAELQISHSVKKRVVKHVKKATRTRWLSTESTVDDVFLNFVPLIQTLQIYSNDSDPVAINLITQRRKWKKFLRAVYLLHEVLPILSHFSRAFQKGKISFAVIAPAIEFILEEMKSVAEKQSPLECLRRDLAEDSRLHYSGVTPLTAHETLLRNLTSKYIHALQDNIASRFKDSLPISFIFLSIFH